MQVAVKLYTHVLPRMLTMATLYKILILCVGFALSPNLWAQSHLDPVNDSKEFAERYSHILYSHRNTSVE